MKTEHILSPLTWCRWLKHASSCVWRFNPVLDAGDERPDVVRRWFLRKYVMLDETRARCRGCGLVFRMETKA